MITTLGDIEVNGGGVGLTSAKGMGIDENGNLLVLDNDGVTSQLIYLTAADLAGNNVANFQDLSPGASLSTALDVFTVGRTAGSAFQTYAYDAAGNGVFYVSPVDLTDPLGRVPVLGTIDTTTGKFSRAIAPSRGPAGTRRVCQRYRMLCLWPPTTPARARFSL